MAMITYPLNNVEYTAEDAELYNCTRTSGVYSGEDFSCTVSGTNNNVTIGEGVGWIRNSRFSGKVFANKAPVTLKLDIADAINPRIDIVAVRFDVETNTTDLVIKKGTAAANPVMPEIVQTEKVYELYLFGVYRETAATVITADNVTDLRLDASVCGLMADAVTSVDTSVINKQFTAYLEHIKKELADLKVDKIDAYTREETFSDFTKETFGLGADAVPDDALAMLNSKKLEMHLLWENASPTSSFSEQTMNFNLSDYDMVMITFNYDSKHYIDNSYFLNIKESESLTQVFFPDNEKIALRNVYVTKSGIKFGRGQRSNYGSSSASSDDTYMMPWKIYGIKGVTTA